MSPSWVIGASVFTEVVSVVAVTDFSKYGENERLRVSTFHSVSMRKLETSPIGICALTVDTVKRIDTTRRQLSKRTIRVNVQRTDVVRITQFSVRLP